MTDTVHPTVLPLVLLGGGGHAIVVAEAAIAASLPIRGFLDDDPAAHLSTEFGDVAPRLGGLDEAHSLRELPQIIAVGDVVLRESLIRRIENPAPPVIHPSAIVSPSALLGRGVFVGPNAVVHARARIGDHVIINTGAIVEHDCAIGINTHVAPAVAMGGGARIGPHTLLGIGSRIVPGAWVGARAIVGAGAVVVESVGEGMTVIGVPARPIEH